MTIRGRLIHPCVAVVVEPVAALWHRAREKAPTPHPLAANARPDARTPRARLHRAVDARATVVARPVAILVEPHPIAHLGYRRDLPLARPGEVSPDARPRSERALTDICAARPGHALVDAHVAIFVDVVASFFRRSDTADARAPGPPLARLATRPARPHIGPARASLAPGARTALIDRVVTIVVDPVARFGSRRQQRLARAPRPARAAVPPFVTAPRLAARQRRELVDLTVAVVIAIVAALLGRIRQRALAAVVGFAVDVHATVGTRIAHSGAVDETRGEGRAPIRLSRWFRRGPSSHRRAPLSARHRAMMARCFDRSRSRWCSARRSSRTRPSRNRRAPESRGSSCCASPARARTMCVKRC